MHYGHIFIPAFQLIYIMARCITVLDTTLCNKVCQCLAVGLWFSPVSSTSKTDCHDIIEILLKLGLNTITLTHI
jgi:hypothetical protein